MISVLYFKRNLKESTLLSFKRNLKQLFLLSKQFQNDPIDSLTFIPFILYKF